MKETLNGEPVLDFVEPENIEWALIDPSTGLLALSKTPVTSLDAFVKGTAPTKYCKQISDYKSSI
jgi:penicillin-binding protein 1A